LSKGFLVIFFRLQYFVVYSCIITLTVYSLCIEQCNALTDTYVMFRYHVTCGIHKKVIAADEKSTLNDVIRQEFSVDESAATVLQSWDAEFEDWVNVTDITQLPDKCKLQIVVKGWHE